ncbi:hypothetical protein [Cryptosporangium japonicum]|uniref:Photosynthesis system II assembly factor Ycf48/Hcf136-like domain-containing protein n=1 Tax=Cryptosporangium japonicum TaxID=80872 RepID=A0ABP3ELU0_9ACTN
MPSTSSARRRSGLIAALVVGAVAVTAGVAIVGPGIEPGPRRPDPTPSTVRWSTTVNQVAFADDRAGWALTPRCASTAECDPAFWRTLDGGVTWQEVAVPAKALGRDSGVQLVAAGPRTIVVEAGRRRWLSDDGGEHWKRGTAVGSVQAAAPPPPRARLRVGSGTPPVPRTQPPSGSSAPAASSASAGSTDGGSGLRPGRVMAWYRPESGQPTAFPGQPDWPPISISSAADGSVWASGGNNQLAVWTGAWRDVRPVLPPPPRTFVQVAAVDRNTAYLLVFGVDDESLLRPSGVSHTADGGRTWKLTSLRGSTLRGSRDAAVVGGRLVVVDSSGGVQVIDPAPSAPRKVPGTPVLWALDSTGSRMVGSGPQDGRYYATANGEQWTELQLPA